jgi:hypothetical protein
MKPMTIAEVYAKYQHLDTLLCDADFVGANITSRILYDLWQAVRAHAQTPTCLWTAQEEGSYWITQCANAHYFIDAGPLENHYHFCPYCGKPLFVVDAPTEEKEKEENCVP